MGGGVKSGSTTPYFCASCSVSSTNVRIPYHCVGNGSSDDGLCNEPYPLNLIVSDLVGVETGTIGIQRASDNNIIVGGGRLDIEVAISGSTDTLLTSFVCRTKFEMGGWWGFLLHSKTTPQLAHQVVSNGHTYPTGDGPAMDGTKVYYRI